LERVPNRDMQFDPSSDDSGTTQPEVVATAGVVPVSAETKPTQPSPPGPDPELVEINRLLEAGETLEAHRKLSVLYWNQPQQRKTLQNQIDRTAQLIYFSPQPHFMPPYEIQPGDQLRQIAGRYKVPWEYLARLNRVDPRTIRSGQQLKVIKGPFSAVVDLSKFELIIHGYGYYIRKYPVGIGRDGSSPQGKFTVLEKVTNPQYTAPDGTVINGDDPANPLGERWIDLGNSYGIHGTIDPNSIGRAESRGCIRMLNADVEEVYDLLSNGSEVQIRR
jgi:lipoprotein-anchoring transpeptidase ErfK/SrfK